MKSKSIIILILLLSPIYLLDLFVQDIRPWDQEGFWNFMKQDTDAKVLSIIEAAENKFVKPGSQAVLFRLLSISDPEKIERQGYWNREHFKKVNGERSSLISNKVIII